MTDKIISSFISVMNLIVLFSAYCLLVSVLHSFQVLRSIDTIVYPNGSNGLLFYAGRNFAKNKVNFT